MTSYQGQSQGPQITTTGLTIEKHEYIWKISDYAKVQQDAAQLRKQSFEIITGTPIPNTKAKWKVGIQLSTIRRYWWSPRGRNEERTVGLFCKLLQVTDENNVQVPLGGPLKATFFAEAYRRDGTSFWSFQREKKVLVGQGFNPVHSWSMVDAHNWPQNMSPDQVYAHIDPETGAKSFLIRLTVMKQLELEVPLTLEQKLLSKSTEKLENDLVAFSLAAKANAAKDGDFKIVCCDGKEFKAHRAILKARNEVFRGMLSSNFKEGSAGSVKVKDVDGPTMELVLHYIYTGELLPNWCDSDMIVEFTYAAGKYQLKDVLEYLDKKLGSVVGVPKDDVWKRTGADLADLTFKLGLNTASTEIRNNFVKGIQEATSFENFFNCKRIKLDEESIALKG